MEDKIKVVELFAGVGGFRLGLEDFGRSPRVGLSVPIFCFLKKKTKGFPLQSLTQNRI